MPKIQFTNTRRILRPTMISAKNLKEPSIPLPKCFKLPILALLTISHQHI